MASSVASRSAIVAAVVVVAATGTGCEESAGTSGSDSTAGAATSAADRATPRGFDLATVTVTTASDDPVDFTMWFAGTPEQWHQGLMDVTDLGDGDGMLFVFDQAADYQFHMWRTPMPLDIMFFDAVGAFVGRADMTPCPDATPDRCARYSPGTPFLTAIEVSDGALDDVDEGTTLRFAMMERTSTSSAP